MKRIVYTVLASLLLFMSVPEAASASSADNLINIGKKYMGTKYRYGGTTTKGFDCSGYTQYVFREAGTPIPRTTGGQYSQGKAVSKANLKTGDLVFFNTSGRGVSHVGIFIKGGKFIHASTSQGVTITPLNDPYYWGKRYIGARRVKDFSDVQVAAPAPAKKKPAPVQKKVDFSRADVAQKLAVDLGLKADHSVLNRFKDVTPKTAKANEISAVVKKGIFSGDRNGNFNPQQPLTRSQAAKVIVEAYNLSGDTSITFKDIKNDKYISILAANKVTTGYDNGNFGPADIITESQFNKFIERVNK